MLVPLLFIGVSNYNLWQIIAAVLSGVFCLIAARLVATPTFLVKTFTTLALIFAVVLSFPYLISSPYAGLVSGILIISFVMVIKEFNLHYMLYRRAGDGEVTLQSARCASYVLILSGFFIYIGLSENLLSTVVVEFLLVLLAWWYITKHLRINFYWDRRKALLLGLPIIMLFWLSLLLNISICIMMFVLGQLALTLLPKSIVVHRYKHKEWDFIFDNPTRLVIISFLVLCFIGALMLHLPIASAKGGAINLLDAAFTAVSAVCVTGLIVLDTAVDYSFIGQLFILILIQLGGLGIMSISVVTLDAIGRRLS
ncbi:MAG: potassium transporter TrkG, partial [Lentisphaeria bacterium]